ncbi:MAG: hypothetical protein WD972_01195 [Candidatus Andersenbacteria bacterium]
MRTFWRQLTAVSILAAASVPLSAHAALINCGYGGLPECEIKDLLQLLVGVYNMLLGLGALVAMLMIIYGGVRMFIFHYFEDAPGELKNAKFTVTRAITGLIIVLAAYLIVNTLIALLGGGDINRFLRPFFN